MLRILDNVQDDWQRVIQYLRFNSKSDVILYYVNQLASLGIFPDDTTFMKLRDLRFKLPLAFYVNLMHSMSTEGSFEEAVKYLNDRVVNGTVNLQSIPKGESEVDLQHKIRQSFEEWIIDIANRAIWEDPDETVFNFLVDDLKADIRPEFCFELIKTAGSVEATDFIVGKMLFQGIKQRGFQFIAAAD